MNILLKCNVKILILILVIRSFSVLPVYSLDMDTTVNDTARTNYSYTTAKPAASAGTSINRINNAVQAKNTSDETIPQSPVSTQVIQNTILPAVPALPERTQNLPSAPVNTLYSGKCPNSEALIPCDIKVSDLIIDESVIKPAVIFPSRTKHIISYQPKKKAPKNVNYRYVCLPAGTQIRAVNTSKITDGMYTGQKLAFLTKQEIYTPYFKIPAGTKLTAEIVNSHRPQLACNGGLITLKIISADINGYTHHIDAGIIRIKTDRVYFNKIKGEHTYGKTVCKKAKWGQNKFNKWSKTSSKLAAKGPGVILAPFPYLGGCVLACASTVSSPVTALTGKGGRLIIPANTTFTLKLNNPAKIRY